MWFTRCWIRGAALTLRCSSYARPDGVAGRWSSLLPPRSCRLRPNPRGIPPSGRSLGSRRNLPMRTPHLRSTSEPSPFALAESTAFSPGFVHTARHGCRAMCLFAPPSTSRTSVHSRSDPKVVASAPRVPPPKSRSALVVLHHLDGFLRCSDCGLVASRCQSWGPPRFRMVSEPCDPMIPPFPAMQDRTPRRNPRRQPLRVTAVVAPLPLQPASRRCSIVGSGVSGNRFRLPTTRSSLGFVPLQGPFDAAGDPSPTAIPRRSAPPRGWFASRQLRCRTRCSLRDRSREPPGTLAAEATWM